MLYTYRLLSILLLLSVLSERNSAAQLADTVIVLPDVTIVATRFAVSRIDAPMNITRIDTSAFLDPKSLTVADVLSRNSSVFVKQYGPGGLATLSTRGTTASQSAILINGLPLVNPQLGQMDLALLPSGSFASAELLSGSASAQFGSSAVGSVVNLRTLSPAKQAATLSFLGGSHGERGVTTSITRKVGAIGFSASGSIYSSEGDFRYRNTSAFPVRWDRRENADVGRKSLLASVARTVGDTETGITILLAAAERGLPTVATIPTNGERQSDQLLRISGAQQFKVDMSTVRIRGFVDRSTLRYVNPELSIDDTGVTSAGMLEAEVNRLDGRVHTTSGVSAAYQNASHPSIEDGRGSQNFAAFSSASFSWGRVLLYPAARLDVHRSSDTRAFVVPSPRLGANISLTESRAIRVKASGSRSFRVPTFNDRYWRGVGARGNSRLQPEKGWSGDIGLHSANPARVENLDIELSLFARIVKDEIVWQPGADGVWQPENIGEVRARGIEFAAALGAQRVFGVPVSGRAQYSFTDARDTSGPEPVGVRYVPRNQLDLSATISTGPFAVDASVAAVGKRLISTDGRQTIPAFATADFTFSAAARLGRHKVTGTIALLNALNEEYAIVKGYPMPPRSARLSIRLEY